MSPDKWLALAAWALLPVAAAAQHEHASPDTGRPAVSGNAVTYQSAFADYRSFADEASAPDKVWRSANDEMGTLGGHAGHIRDVPASKSSASAPERDAGRQSGSMDHGMHHGGHR